MMRALERIEPSIRRGVGDRKVVIKPNLTRVGKEDWLASTHVDSIWAICELISSFYRRKIIVAEGTGPGTPLQEALDNYGYKSLKERFNVEFVDLRSDTYSSTYITNKEIQPVPIRLSRLLTDPDTYLISAAVLKTHDLSVVTLGLKNVVMAAPMNFGPGRNDRAKMHRDNVSEDPRVFNFNLFELSRQVRPDLVTIDGFVGMEGEGPIGGDPVESNLAIAGTDWLATDRVGVEVMGFDFARIGHYRYCAEAKMGEADLARIQVPGESLGNCKRQYKAPPSMQKIMM
jgi:uncharacterized protein (DUF362 family)